ncbi:S8 family serine peptidase [Arthrobacter sp. NPDC093139]|uniref:S8 family serine peptidase n=1 Tax=Arthrobacter sp. NPDC093139 TaxID=3363945 RepID=UPI0037F123C2
MTSAAGSAPTDQIIVKFKEQARTGAVERGRSYAAAGSKVGAVLKDVRGTSSGARVLRAERNLPPSDTSSLLETLRADPKVAYAEVDLRMKPMSFPSSNDTYYPLQWDFFEAQGGMRVPGAWSVSKGKGVVVAVVDTGITDHSDLNANVLPGYDMISNSYAARDGDGRDANPQDEGDWTSAGQCFYGSGGGQSSWHGTHVAGTVAALTDNNQGVAGVAPEAKILPLRALGACGGYTSDIADAIIWAAGGSVEGIPDNANPARVVNLSLGGSGACSITYQSAINLATSRGAAIVVASGNENRPAAESSPANCQNVITVGASTRNAQRAPYSNYGPVVDVMAPGGDIRWRPADGIASTLNDGVTTPGAEAYYYQQGTSMAAPHVAGVAAMLVSNLGEKATPAYIEQRLKATVRTGHTCLDPTFCLPSVPMVDASAAVQPDPELTAGSPAIVGVVAMNRMLTVEAGAWGPALVSLSYQWLADEAPIPGATGTSFTPSKSELGKLIAVEVTGTKARYATASRTSSSVGPIESFSISAGQPTVTGVAAVGETVAAQPGDWQPTDVSLAYQWSRNGVALEGATGATYTVPPTDLGAVLAVTVTGSSAKADSVWATSPPTSEVTPGVLINSPAPIVIGTPMVGQRLTAQAGNWAPSPVELTFQWHRSGTPVTGATGVFYDLGAEDRGHNLSVTVTGEKQGYEPVARSSAATSTVVQEVQPRDVTFLDKDGTAEDSYTIPTAEGVEYLMGEDVVEAGTYTGAGEVTVTARAKSDYVFTNGAVTSWTTTFRATPYEVIPADVVFTDKDGTTEDTYIVPAVEGVEYLVGDEVVEAGTHPGTGAVTVTARAKADYALRAGAVAEWTATFKATPYEVTPTAVVFTDKDGTAEDTYMIPATDGVEYLVGENVVEAGTYPGTGAVTVTAGAKADYVLKAGAVAEWTATFKATPYEVTPAAVVFTDKDGTAEDTYVIPATDGVEYMVGGKTVAAGTYPGAGTVSVVAKAKMDYVLKAGSVTTWSATFKAVFRMTMIVAAGDLNSDGKADVLARDSAGTLWLSPGNGQGGWLTRVRLGGGWNAMNSIAGAGDLSGDGKADVLARDSGGTLWIYPGNGRGGWLTRIRVGGGWNAMNSIVGSGDLSGDGRADVLARDSGGTLWIYPGNGRGGWLTRIRVGGGWNAMTAVVGPGDLTGDRRADVLARDSGGTLWIYPGNGLGGWLARVRVGGGWNAMTTIAGRGDFSGDGRTDALAVDAAGVMWLYKGNGAGNWLGRISMGVGWN